MNANNSPTRHWAIRPELVSETEAHYRNKIVTRISNLSPLEKVRLVTFDGVAPDIRYEDARDFIRFVDHKMTGGKMRGTGLEVGAGSGFFVAILASMPEVESVYAVEVSRPIVEELMPEIVECFSQGNGYKVVPCVGDFSSLEIPEGSVDFIIDFFSLHHSDDLNKTFKEMFRVLKPGGIIICLDKARADALTDIDLDALLDKEYSRQGKEFMGLDPDISWTRRMNGEREFRLRDWQKFAEHAGLRLTLFSHVSMTKSPNPIFHAVKHAVSLLPLKPQMHLTHWLGFAGRKHPNNLETKNVIFSPHLNNFPKEISVMIFSK